MKRETVSVIEARDLCMIKNGSKIFEVERFILNKGETLAIVGPNGAGKTSFLQALALLDKPVRGTIFFNGEVVTRDKILRFRRRMAVVFQEPLLLDTTVQKNILTGLRIRGVPGKEAILRAEEWMKRLGIIHLAQRPAKHLSGGEAQRANLARALALKPEVLFLDEPFSALDYPTKKSLLGELGNLLKDSGISTIFVTHDYTEIPFLAERVAVMYNGKFVKTGTFEEVWGNDVRERRILAPWEDLE